MRTDTQKNIDTGKVNVEDKVKETMKVVRKQLHPLQESARDKENLVGAGRVVCTSTAKDSKENVPKPLHKLADTGVGKVEKKKKQPHPKTEKKAAEKKGITVDDLTCDAGPSEHYWETLAERRRVALEKALKENEQLHERISLLEQENEQYKVLLDEAKTVIETFQEIMAEPDQQ